MAGLNAASAAFQFHKGTIRTLTEAQPVQVKLISIP